MFELKKILTAYMMPPGIFVVILLIAGIWFFVKRWRFAGIFNITIAIALWALSINPVSDYLLRGLEHEFVIPKKVSADVIVLMGGGSDLQAPDLTGIGSPGNDMLARVVTTARLYKQLKVPVIITSGKAFENKPSEAPIIKRFLMDLDVPEAMIILEDKSRDSIENARYTKEICLKKGFKRLAVVTSAFHMQRTALSFKKVGLDITPVPAKYKTWQNQKYYWEDYLPNASNLFDSSIALKEYVGLVFYKIAY